MVRRADGGALRFGATLRRGCVPLLVAHPCRHDREDRGDEHHVAREPHQSAGELLVGERVDPVRAAQRRVVRVERRAREQDRHPEERVDRQLQEQVAGTRRVGEPARRRVGRDDRPPEQERGTEEQAVLEVVDATVLEREIEQRREVAEPDHEREGQPGDDRMPERDTTVEWRIGRSQR